MHLLSYSHTTPAHDKSFLLEVSCVQMTSDDEACRTEFAELQQALVTALTASGALGTLRAQLRQASLAVLRDDNRSLDRVVPSRLNLQTLTEEQRVGLLVVDEFLGSLGLTLTHGMLQEEAAIETVQGSNPPGLEALPRQAGTPVLLTLLRRATGGGGGGVQGVTTAASPSIGRADPSEDPTDWSVAGTQQQQQAMSPSVERSAVATSQQRAMSSSSVTEVVTRTTVTTVSETNVSTAAAQRRASSLPAEADYDPSVEYSDRSIASSLDALEFDHMELVKQAAPASASTSDDDF